MISSIFIPGSLDIKLYCALSHTQRQRQQPFFVGPFTVPYRGSGMLGRSRGLPSYETFSLAVLWKGNIIRSHPTPSWWSARPSSCPLSEGNTKHASFSGSPTPHSLWSVSPLVEKVPPFWTRGRGFQFHKNICPVPVAAIENIPSSNKTIWRIQLPNSVELENWTFLW